MPRTTHSTVPEVYDFRRPSTLSREHTRLLEMAYETFSRQWSTQLSARTRQSAQVSLRSVAMTSYDEYLRPLPDSTAMLICTVEPSRQTAVLQMPVPALMVWLDHMLGGNGHVAETHREFTEIEQSLLHDVLNSVLNDIGYAFASVSPLSLAYRSVQYNPQFVQAVPASDSVIVAAFDVTWPDRVDEATLMIPAESILAALRQAENTEPTDDEAAAIEQARRELDGAVAHVPVTVHVALTPREVHPRDVVDLHVGDVLPLHHPSARPLDVVVGGVVLAHAAIGNSGSRLACRITTTVEEKTL